MELTDTPPTFSGDQPSGDKQAFLSKGDTTLKKTAARVAAVKILYRMEFNPDETDLDEMLAEEAEAGTEIVYRMSSDGSKPVFGKVMPALDLCRQLVTGVNSTIRQLDEIYTPYLEEGWSIEKTPPVLRAIIRAAVYEMYQYRLAPEKAIITEYTNIARAFYDEEESGFTNALLDRLLKERKPEIWPQANNGADESQ